MYQPSSYPNEVFNIVIQFLYLCFRKSNHKKITNIAVILCSYKCNGQNISLYEDHCDIMNMTSWPLIKFTQTLMFFSSLGSNKTYGPECADTDKGIYLLIEKID